MSRKPRKPSSYFSTRSNKRLAARIIEFAIDYLDEANLDGKTHTQVLETPFPEKAIFAALQSGVRIINSYAYGEQRISCWDANYAFKVPRLFIRTKGDGMPITIGLKVERNNDE